MPGGPHGSSRILLLGPERSGRRGRRLAPVARRHACRPVNRARRARLVPHFAPKATRAIHICLCGAMSHVDTFDYKPGLIAAHGQSLKSSTQARRLLRPGRPAAEARLGVSPARPERAVGLGPVPQPGRGGRRADGDPLDGRRHLEPHAGDVSGEQRLSPQRVPGDGRLAELRAGERVGRPAGVRRDSRTPASSRPAARSTGPTASCPPGTRAWSSARRESRSTTSSPSRPICPGRRIGHARAGRRDEPPTTSSGTAATMRSRPGFAATRWPPGCRRRSPWSPT